MMMMMMTVFNALGKENQLNRKHDANCVKPGDKSSKHQSYLLARLHTHLQILSSTKQLSRKTES